MYIKTFRIIATDNDTDIRTVAFRQGINLVVDNEQSDKHNKVGKTTFLRCLDILLGAKDKKTIHHDHQLQQENSELKNLINDSRIAIEGVFTPDLSIPDHEDELTCKVDLFERGGRYINGSRYSYENYVQELNRIFFAHGTAKPTFRMLIKSFIRISARSDDPGFLKNLESTSLAFYHSIYDVLLGLGAHSHKTQSGDTEKKLNALKKAHKTFLELRDTDEINTKKSELEASIESLDTLEQKLEALTDLPAFRKFKDAQAELYGQFSRAYERRNELEYELAMIDLSIQEIEQERDLQAEIDIQSKFYAEVAELVPHLDKTFKQMLSFNQRLIENKLKYFSDLKSDTHEQLLATQNEIGELVGNHEVLNDPALDEFRELNHAITELTLRIGELQEFVNTAEQFEEEITSLEAELEQHKKTIEASKHQAKQRIASFNYFFSEFSEEINQEHPVLKYYHDIDHFPLEIVLPNGASSGSRKSLMAAYDLAYQEFAKSNNIIAPRFFIHDVVENIEGADLRHIIDICEDTEAQMIVAVLHEKLASAGLTEQEIKDYTILNLSTDSKLFCD
ncbi:DUF2326 domain-containing protein [Corynebacterium pseudogenitalium]|uniref:DUF2326 domain-containing protein n=1 Tax=Corynebacterium pseudogenitalium TaxID=38303 RepID=UPI00210A63E1|nr:DUF2326 domain-containing protein [Corynebacterium pseudogenitalium]UUA87207.1 DUF2326 domain-containing protein [Corynebacterium pseudogenitalium]